MDVGMREIPLTKGHVAIVDDCDFARVSKFKWHALASETRGRVYAVRKDANNRLVYLHRDIVQAADDVLVDHRDRNGLHCWRSNLRLCTQRQNRRNRGPQSNNHSGFKGVSFDKARGKWAVYIKSENRKINVGRFDDVVEAAKAYDRMAQQIFGEFAYTNFAE